MNRIQIGKLEDIPRQGSRIVNTAHGEIAVFRTVGDQVFALNNRCPHKGGPLAQGIVHGQRVTCPLHSWVVDLATGSAIAPDTGCAHRYDVQVEEGVLFLDAESRECKA